jgi:hypothetical protein
LTILIIYILQAYDEQIELKGLSIMNEYNIGDTSGCRIHASKCSTARKIMDIAIMELRNTGKNRVNLIWLEATGCSGNIISLLNAEDPDVNYLFNEMVNLTYENSLMAAEGEAAFQQFMDTLNTEFILVVEGAVSIRDEGFYNVIARYQGRPVTAMEAVRMAGEKAKICACRRNLRFLRRDIGCQAESGPVHQRGGIFGPEGDQAAYLSLPSGLGYRNDSQSDCIWRTGVG